MWSVGLTPQSFRIRWTRLITWFIRNSSCSSSVTRVSRTHTTRCDASDSIFFSVPLYEYDVYTSLRSMWWPAMSAPPFAMKSLISSAVIFLMAATTFFRSPRKRLPRTFPLGFNVASTLSPSVDKMTSFSLSSSLIYPFTRSSSFRSSSDLRKTIIFESGCLRGRVFRSRIFRPRSMASFKMLTASTTSASKRSSWGFGRGR
mmetsp:Transcript_35435/g.99860  ORF Transcript_35435/g.99860 Transcript_35435/m.99860 type:complete len:202 (-) Transcript_35435:2476-3081(-)